jgi:hypothetical protein
MIADLCCSDRETLEKNFGDEVIVKLDLFHGLQRITRTMKNADWTKANKIQFKRDLRLTLRQKQDHGHIRKMATPSAEEIYANFDSLMAKWSKISIETTDAIIRLQQEHSSCLADIAVGGGTNRNENLHKKINSYFKSMTSITIDRALALLTILFIKHNRSVYNDNTPLISMSCSEYDRTKISTGLSTEDLIGYGLPRGAGFGVLPERAVRNNLSESTCVTIGKNVKNLLRVEASLNLNSIGLNSMEVLLCCPSGGFKPGTKFTQLDFTKLKDDFHVVMTGSGYSSFEEAVGTQFLAVVKQEEVVSILKSYQQHLAMNPEICLLQELQRQKTHQNIADILQSVMIVVDNNIEHPINSWIPKKVTNVSQLIIIKDGDCFFTTISEWAQQFNSPQLHKCSCGASRKGTKKNCTPDNNCKCALAGVACGTECRCQRCSNPSGIRQMKSKKKGCSCGNGAAKGNGPSCKINRCKCFLKDSKCTNE